VASLSEICDWQSERAREMFVQIYGKDSVNRP
jgi:hypothetical protein